MKKIKNFKLGTDFEVFLQDKNTSEIVSAEGIIKGSKYNPYFWDKNNKGYATSLDNVLAEANIPPARSAYQFYKSVQKAINYINSTIPQNLQAVPLPSARLDREKYLMTDNALLLGCEPDLCIYTLDFNPKPDIEDDSTVNLRSAGGHLHIGYEEPSLQTNIDIIRALDLFIGVPGVIQEPDNERKVLYGKAGACRFKQYGVEYRSPSNYYLTSKELTTWVYDSVKEAINFINNDNTSSLYQDEEYIVKAINNNDKDLAKELIKNYNLTLA